MDIVIDDKAYVEKQSNENSSQTVQSEDGQLNVNDFKLLIVVDHYAKDERSDGSPEKEKKDTQNIPSQDLMQEERKQGQEFNVNDNVER